MGEDYVALKETAVPPDELRNALDSIAERLTGLTIEVRSFIAGHVRPCLDHVLLAQRVTMLDSAVQKHHDEASNDMRAARTDWKKLGFELLKAALVAGLAFIVGHLVWK